jgi:hypothetical protein
VRGVRAHPAGAGPLRVVLTVATGTCPMCGQEDIPLLFRKFLRDHLTDAKDPYSERCPGKAPVSLPPPRRPGPKRQPSAPRELREAAASTSALSAVGSRVRDGSIELSWRRIRGGKTERPKKAYGVSRPGVLGSAGCADRRLWGRAGPGGTSARRPGTAAPAGGRTRRRYMSPGSGTRWLRLAARRRRWPVGERLAGAAWTLHRRMWSSACQVRRKGACSLHMRCQPVGINIVAAGTR